MLGKVPKMNIVQILQFTLEKIQGFSEEIRQILQKKLKKQEKRLCRKPIKIYRVRVNYMLTIHIKVSIF